MSDQGVAPVWPEYDIKPGATRGLARFPDGSTIRVTCDRTRAYPGLRCGAPDTTPYYRWALDALRRARTVLDVGCGAGIGTHLLASPARRILACDADPDAIEFASRSFPGPEYFVADFVRPAVNLRCDGAVVIDLLSCAKSPVALLNAARDTMVPGALLVVAEPRAHTAQVLRPPVRTGFSRTSIEAILRAAGFEPARSLPDGRTFLLVSAVAVERPGRRELARGLAEMEDGRADAAVLSLSTARAAGDPSVAREATLALAQLLGAQGAGDDAAGLLLGLLETAPTNARAHAALASLIAATGGGPDAAYLATRAVELDATEPSAWRALAELREASGDPSALDAWYRALHLAPSDLQLAARVARSLAAVESFDEAAAVLERAGAYLPAAGADYHVLLARLLDAAGRTADALIEARMARARSPHDPDVAALCDDLASASIPL